MEIPGLNAKTERITHRRRSENNMEGIREASHELQPVLLHIKMHGRLHNPTPASSQASPCILSRRSLRQNSGLSLVFPAHLFDGWRHFRGGLL